MASRDILFSPFSVAGLELPTRIVMAPMTRSRSPHGVPGPDVAAYYARRAANYVGLIMTEGTAVDHPAAVANPNIPRFHGEEALAGWARVRQAVHAAGGRIFPQLWHVGMARKPGAEPNPESPPIGPSGFTVTGEPVSEPMTEAAILDAIESYAVSAGHAARLGFDGIELHGAHGYLLDQFLWSGTNRRTDHWGQDLVGRTRFAVEVVRACRRATPPGFPIVFRFSQWKIPAYDARLAETPAELAQLLEPLVEAGVDMFHCSTRRFWEHEFEGSPLNLAGWTRRLTGRPVITVGSVGLDNDFIAGLFQRERAATAGLDRLIEMLETGEVDLVAVGRALLVDPEWATKLHDGRLDALRPYTADALATLS
jgi:2,4-dienoyl-CoA reductase-like NADH-dependent reductase (Old Yellow Enzyme family)